MDALLRYVLYQTTWTVLFAEVLIMVICCVAIMLIKIATKWTAKRNHHIQDELSKLIEYALFHMQALRDFHVPNSIKGFRNIIEILERFEQRITDPIWREVKSKIIDGCLLPNMEKYVKSWSWVKRQLAARCCLLFPEKASEKHLKILLDDSKFLVRVVAAVCIIQTSYKDLFYQVIHHMSRETPLSRFSYRDALIQASPEKFLWLEELLKSDSSVDVKVICLDILSTRVTGNLLALVKPYINAENRECRRLAIQVLKNIPSEESIALLMKHLGDSDWEIRTEVIQGLSQLYAVKAIPNLRELLDDPVWWVRLQAALALKQFGKDGLQILAAQGSDEPAAYEIAQYVLALPS